MSPYTICLSILILMGAILLFFYISLILEKFSHREEFLKRCFVIIAVMFLTMAFVTAYFEGQETPQCPICQERVNTNYCPNCGSDMKAIIEIYEVD